MNDKIHTCDCGFSWKHGMSGNHWCPDGYRDKITKLEAENKKLKEFIVKTGGPMLLELVMEVEE